MLLLPNERNQKQSFELLSRMNFPTERVCYWSIMTSCQTAVARPFSLPHVRRVTCYCTCTSIRGLFPGMSCTNLPPVNTQYTSYLCTRKIIFSLRSDIYNISCSIFTLYCVKAMLHSPCYCNTIRLFSVESFKLF